MKNILSLFAILYLFAASVFAQHQTTPNTALVDYLGNNDSSYGWEVRDTFQKNQVDVYSLLLISQKWQNRLWKHELIVLVPQKIENDGALLFITGGSIDNGIPNFSNSEDKFTLSMTVFAEQNKAIVAILRQVPNQPLYNGLREDALISYTLNQFRKDSDYSWPLLFPMVKSATKAMDAVQEFTVSYLKKETTRFVVSGASKRGWTTWLTGAAADKRVKAIAPMVIDLLNMPKTLEYQKEIYGEYSQEINDYVELGIPQAMNNDFGKAIVTMIDPYSYREKLTMPKMIFMGTNDEYWTADAVKHYINQIPGENMLNYVPNAGHGLGDKVQVFKTLGAFYNLTINDGQYPLNCSSVTVKKKSISVNVSQQSPKLLRAVCWTAFSDTRDFRKSEWKSREIKINDATKTEIDTTINFPRKGYTAFYVDLIYPSPLGGEFSVSTRMYVADQRNVFVE